MAKETVLIGCRLPNGLIMHHPANRELAVRLAGTHGKPMDNGLWTPPQPYSVTRVSSEFWEAWKAVHQGYAPLKTRAIFECQSEEDARSISKEMAKHKTGFEGMSKSAVIDGIKMEQG